MVSTIVYPEASVRELVNLAVKYCAELDGVYFQSTGKIKVEKDRFYLLIDGQIRVEHTENGRTLGIFMKNIIIGVIEQNYLLRDISYSGSKKCLILSVSSQKFYAMLSEYNLMIHMVVVMSYFIAKLLEYYHAMMERNAYVVVKKLIERYMSYLEMQTENKETIVTFILTRSTLSRSITMKILADLYKGGYIEKNSSGTIQIVRTLPKKY